MTTALELALYVENTGILRVMTERDTTEQLAAILLEFTLTVAEQGTAKLLPVMVRGVTCVESMRETCNVEGREGV
jgi:hypothetical protein